MELYDRYLNDLTSNMIEPEQNPHNTLALSAHLVLRFRTLDGLDAVKIVRQWKRSKIILGVCRMRGISEASVLNTASVFGHVWHTNDGEGAGCMLCNKPLTFSNKEVKKCIPMRDSLG